VVLTGESLVVVEFLCHNALYFDPLSVDILQLVWHFADSDRWGWSRCGKGGNDYSRQDRGTTKKPSARPDE
jgi:hypothetical protein